MAEWRGCHHPERAGPQPAATKRYGRAGAGGGEEVSKQRPAAACTFSYWLSLYPLPLYGCQIPYSSLCVKRGPLPCPLISISPSSHYHRYRLISFKGGQQLLLMLDSQPSLSTWCQRGCPNSASLMKVLPRGVCVASKCKHGFQRGDFLETGNKSLLSTVGNVKSNDCSYIRYQSRSLTPLNCKPDRACNHEKNKLVLRPCLKRLLLFWMKVLSQTNMGI